MVDELKEGNTSWGLACINIKGKYTVFSRALHLTSHKPRASPSLQCEHDTSVKLGLRVHALLTSEWTSFTGMACETGLCRVGKLALDRSKTREIRHF